MVNGNILLPSGLMLDGGKYIIEKPLASGGFGNTYLVNDTKMSVKCVVKEFFMRDLNVREGKNVKVGVPEKQHIFDAQRLKFAKEARRLFNINNPHIIRVHSLFEENGTSYYVMDYIDGYSLFDLLNRQAHRFTLGQTLDILYQMLDALQVIHSQSEPLFHLDIKPGNIMLETTGRAVLIDFGASKQFDADGNMASTSMMMSYTSGYAPIEQIENNFSKIGPWTDFYALGATIYQLLTNRRPPSITGSYQSDAFIFSPEMGEDMKYLICWMMSPTPGSRPKNVNEIFDFLDQPTVPIGRGSKLDISNRKKWMFYVFVFLLLFLLGGIMWYIISHNNMEKDTIIIPDTKNENEYERKQDTPVSEAFPVYISNEELYDIIFDVIKKWDKAHDLNVVYQLPQFYADKVIYYGKERSREEIFRKKKESMVQHLGYSQVSSKMKMERLSDSSVLCYFDKHTWDGKGNEEYYPSYLRFEKIRDSWYIVEESDAVTDYNLRNREKK